MYTPERLIDRSRNPASLIDKQRFLLTEASMDPDLLII